MAFVGSDVITISGICGAGAVTLIFDSAKLFANALVFSRLDYCNSLLYGIADSDLTKLQRIQNRLPHIVTKSSPFSLSVPLLRSLLSVRRVKTNTSARAFYSCAPSLKAICRCLSIEPFQLLPSRNIWRRGLSPIDTSMPHGLLMLRNCFIDFAVEHRLAVDPVSLAVPGILAL